MAKELRPLRSILRSTIDEYGVFIDLLACGHRIHSASDIYGPRYPDRRRCRKCKSGEPQDFDPAEEATTSARPETPVAKRSQGQ